MTTTSKSSKTKKDTGKTSHSLVNISEGNEEYVVYVVVPGMLRDDISISIKNGQLTVTASKKEALHCFMDNDKQDFSRWTKCIDLPADADTVMTAAVYRNGELQIHIPKGKAEEAGEPTEVFVY
jgi:HSP20 family protein